GRITHGDLGIWSDAHGEALAPAAAFLKAQGSVPAIQLAHAGRKASMQRPWFGNGPLGPEDAKRGEVAWPVLGPTETPLDDGWLIPKAMTADDIAAVTAQFAAAARRALAAGFEAAEIHGGHGYLIQSFLSPASNTRTDGYGGSLEGRMRLALEVTEAVRAVWPEDKPLFFRISSVDGFDGGWEIEDSVVLAKALSGLGVDVIDCSSGGNTPRGATNAGGLRGPGFQVPYAARVRADTGMKTQAVGLILDGPQAEAILQAGDADLIAIARAALHDPFWPLHQAEAMGADPEFARWPEQYGWWLTRRASALRQYEEAMAKKK
ncbi:MAG TPA: NADH:flavin oxidoreductase/NADH oxidase, partial [Hyphomicrobiales bacterium]|nr:NADH:flavin oxidoreductase/NADH oxidase [Hyphomicrobiales bacterium]